MIRVLLIGREAPALAESLAKRIGAQFEFDTATMPAAGLRHFEATPPDALVVVDPAQARRAATLARAIRERPLGQLIPILIVAPQPAPEARGLADYWLAPAEGDARLVDALFEALDIDSGAAPTENAAPAPPAYFIEEIDEPDPSDATHSQTHVPAPDGFDVMKSVAGFSPQDAQGNRPRHIQHASIFPSSGSRLHDLGAHQGQVDAAAVQQKLQAVRHRDYYAILEIRHGAEGTLVREAFHRLYRQFDPDQMDFSLAHRFEAELAEIRDALEDAWAVLGDPKLREAYLEQAIRG